MLYPRAIEIVHAGSPARVDMTRRPARAPPLDRRANPTDQA
jgi:hypothetical protein